jgi:hypothetical protein
MDILENIVEAKFVRFELNSNFKYITIKMHPLLMGAFLFISFLNSLI